MEDSLDYNLLAKKIAEELAKKIAEELVKSPTRDSQVHGGNAYFRRLWREKNKLEHNYVPPESVAPLVSQEYYEQLVALGIEGRNAIDPKIRNEGNY